MKLRHLLILVVLLAAVAAGWLLTRPKTPDPADKTASAPAPDNAQSSAQADAPKSISPVATMPPTPPPVVEPKRVEMPKAPVAQVSKPAADKAATPSPRADLSTMIPELARLINAQDYETLMQDFMPPDELNDLLTRLSNANPPRSLGDLANNMRQDPEMVQTFAAISQFLGYLETQTPTMNEAGDAASYKIPIAINGENSVNFVKVDGNWYVKDGEAFFR